MSGTDTKHSKHEKPITYVLAGDDHNEAMKEAVDNYAKQKNVIVLRASDYPSLEDAAKQIKPPANIVIACHGEVYESGNATGTFTWREDDDSPSYSDLFNQLKTNPSASVGVISVLSCLGEVALDMLEDVPAGTVLQSLIGASAASNAKFAEDFQLETIKATDPTTLILEALDNVDPKNYLKLVSSLKDFGIKKEETEDPKNLLPTIIGIGGNPPIVIDLDANTNQLASASQKDPKAFARAIHMVKQHFDIDKTQAWIETVENTLGENDFQMLLKEIKSSGSMSPELQEKIIISLQKSFPDSDLLINEKTLDKYFARLTRHGANDAKDDLEDKITAVAEKIKNGEPIALDKDGNPDFDELRIRRALGVAYLKTSGEMDKLIEQAKESAKPKEMDAPSKVPQNDKPSIMSEDKALNAAPQKNDYGALLGKYGLSKDDFSNVALDPSTPTYAAYKLQSQGVDTGRTA